MALADYLLLDYVLGCQHFVSGLHISLHFQSLGSKPDLILMFSPLSHFLDPCLFYS